MIWNQPAAFSNCLKERCLSPLHFRISIQHTKVCIAQILNSKGLISSGRSEWLMYRISFRLLANSEYTMLPSNKISSISCCKNDMSVTLPKLKNLTEQLRPWLYSAYHYMAKIKGTLDAHLPENLLLFGRYHRSLSSRDLIMFKLPRKVTWQVALWDRFVLHNFRHSCTR